MDTIKTSFEKIKALARQEGAAVELLISGSENLKLGYQKKKLEKFESTQSQMAGFRVILKGSQGYAYTENLSDDSLLLTFREALQNAKVLQNSAKQKDIPLAKPNQFQTLDFLKAKNNVDIEQKLKLAAELEEKVLAQDPRIHSVPYGGYVDGESFVRVLNSEGLDAQYSQNYFSAYAYALAKEGEVSKMDGDATFAREFAQIDSSEIAKEGASKALSRLGAKKIKTGMYPTIWDREVVSTLVHMLEPHLSARQVLDGKSLLKDKVGSKIGSDVIEIIDDPLLPEGRASRPFDSEGTASQKTVLFSHGVLKTYLTNAETAQELGVPNTGHASRSPASKLDIASSNLIIKAGATTRDEMLKRYPEVVVITEIAGGLHAGYKETTGDFSLPCEGFLYRQGKLVHAVDQFVVSGNIFDLLKNVEAVGAEYNKTGDTVRAPDLLITQLSYAGE
ncbi:MAG: TldD/PmbA family protein [Bdellovibrionia bacterium]